jgi:fumarate reductase subunit D
VQQAAAGEVVPATLLPVQVMLLTLEGPEDLGADQQKVLSLVLERLGKVMMVVQDLMDLPFTQAAAEAAALEG